MSIEVVHNAEAERYEITVDGEFAGFTEAHPLDDPPLDGGSIPAGGAPNRVLFPHTVIESAFEGQGLASKLVAGAFDDIRRRGLTIVPTCPYILGWLPKHPDYHDLLAPPD